MRSVRADVDDVVGCDQAHALIEISLVKCREPFGQTFRLPRHELDRLAPVPRSDSLHRPATERTFSVVDENRLGCLGSCGFRFHRLARLPKRRAANHVCWTRTQYCSSAFARSPRWREKAIYELGSADRWPVTDTGLRQHIARVPASFSAP